MTQVEKILRHLDEYGSITAAEAMNEYGIYRLASRIRDIKRAGYSIDKVTETSRNRYGEPVRFARYMIKD